MKTTTPLDAFLDGFNMLLWIFTGCMLVQQCAPSTSYAHAPSIIWLQCDASDAVCDATLEAAEQINAQCPILQFAPSGGDVLIRTASQIYGRPHLEPTFLPYVGTTPPTHLMATTFAYKGRIVIAAHPLPDQWAPWELRGMMLHELMTAIGFRPLSRPEGYTCRDTNWLTEQTFALSRRDKNDLQRYCQGVH